MPSNPPRAARVFIALSLGLLCLEPGRSFAEPVEPCLAFSPYVDEFSPEGGPHPGPMAIDALLDAVVARTSFRCIQTYGVLEGLDYTIAAAHERGITVYAILWLDRDTSVNQQSIARGIELAKQYPTTITRLSCGSEVRTRHRDTALAESVVGDCVARLRAANVVQPITSNDTWWAWCDQSDPCQPWTLASQLDWIGVNVFAWWENKYSGLYPCTPAEAAVDFTIGRVQAIKDRYPGKTVILTEAGWPAGPYAYTETNVHTKQRCGIASEANHQLVVNGLPARLRTLGWPGVVFSAFREPWKARLEGPVGPFWGILNSPFVHSLAEGATGPFFDTDVLIANPTAAAAPVKLTFLKPDGSQVVRTWTVAAQSRTTIRVDDIAGLADTAFSTVVTSTDGVPIVVERSMFWGPGQYGGHTETAVDGPSTRWYFAEGHQGFFDTYVLLANSSNSTVTATITFLREGLPPVVKSVPVPSTSRVNVNAGSYGELLNQSFSIIITAPAPILAERAMYWSSGGQFWIGGHASAGVTAPATSWFHAEGATGPYFDTYLLLGNPNGRDAHVTLTYLLVAGAPIVKSKIVRANNRLTVNLEGDDPQLANTAVSTTVTSDVPIISERAMYWPGTGATWSEAHNSFGVTSTGTRWGLAEGRVGGEEEYQTYILLGNPSMTTAATVKLTFLRTTGTTVTKTVNVPPTSRFNVWVNGDTSLADESFGTLIEVQNGVPIAVERALYWNVGGVMWAGGTNATATRLR